ncbi:calcitonin gene-related peptide 2-like [Pteropus medius]|uniref:calcitonin gene-related peptide 2-like n=1 Tax=Pteropus vampyrus TaxID=132908 RepID=UPI00196AA792|nr:calcitonin gene-related peptide 2-like [Pteropus giganteus]
MIFPLQRGMMGFWKFSPFLALGFLVLYQMGNLQAAPFNSDSQTTQTTLDTNKAPEENGSPILKFFKKMIDKRETQDSSITTQKRECKTSTCVMNKLADMLSKRGGVWKSAFLPTDIGPIFLGRRLRDLHDSCKKVELPKDLHLQELYHLDSESLKCLKTSGMAASHQ